MYHDFIKLLNQWIMLEAKIAADAPISDEIAQEQEVRPIVFKGKPVKNVL